MLETKNNINLDKLKKRRKYLINESKHHLPSTREWYNSVYNFNKNTIKPLPVLDNYILGVIKSYFNLFIKSLEKTTGTHEWRKWMRRSSITRILVSKVELKHTNDKILIDIYIFNRQKNFYLNKINKLKGLIPKSSDKILSEIKLRSIENKTKEIIKIVLNKLNLLNEIKNSSILYKHHNNINAKLIKIPFKIEKLYLLIKRNLYINNNKLKSTYIMPLIKIIKKIYKKDIQFNIVSLKYPYLDSNIYLQLLTIKLRSHKNKIINVINKSLSKVRVLRKMKLITLSDMYIVRAYRQDTRLDFFKSRVNKIKNKDLFSLILDKHIIKEIKESLNFESHVLGYIRNKTFIGLRIEASGRLTRRITASRALFKIKHKGGIKNIESSFKGMSTTSSKGYLESNLDFTKSNSVTRIGSYGLKAWVNTL